MEQNKWEQEIEEKIIHKMRIVAERNKGKIPFSTEDGRYNDCSSEEWIGCWTNGFWGGMMWQLYHATKDPIFRAIAEETEEKLDRVLMKSFYMDHDSGFRWLLTAVADYKLTGNVESRNRAILAADNLAGRFNPVGKFLRAWNNFDEKDRTGWTIIDCMMNLPLLYWAYQEIGDPRYLQIAMMHADTAQKYSVREDGSVNHIVEINPSTGEYIRSYGGQGYKEGSSWTRGQAWALYGFAISYIHTQNRSYLNTAKKVANYFIANIPDNGLIPVDFRQPADCHWQDSSAAAIAACGLLEISRLLERDSEVEAADSRIYRKSAYKLLMALCENSVNWDDNCDNLLEKCSSLYDESRHEYPLIYGDYYFIEAIWKLTGKELFVW